MEGPHGSGPEPPETVAFIKGMMWGVGLTAVVLVSVWFFA
jgi:hypothetical protein